MVLLSIALRHNLASNYRSIIGKSIVSLYRLWQHDFGHNVGSQSLTCQTFLTIYYSVNRCIVKDINYSIKFFLNI